MRTLIKAYVTPYIGMMLLALVFMAVAAAMTAAVAQLMQPILDEVLNGKNADVIAPIGIAVFATFVIRGFATYLHTIIMAKVGQSIVADIQKDLFSHFLTLDLSFFHDNPSGQLISRVTHDVQILRGAISDSLAGIGRSFLTLIFLIAVMFYQDWKLSIAAFTIFPFAAIFVAYIGKKLRHVSKSIQEEFGNLTDRLSQIFQGVRQVKAYGSERFERDRAGALIDRVKKLNIKSARVGNMSTPVNEVLVGIVAAGIITYGGYQVFEGAMTTGQLGAFLAAFIMAYEPMKKLAKLNNVVQMGLGAAERIFQMLSTKPKIKNKTGATELKSKKPSVIFKNVTFEYEKNSEVKALNGVSFKAEPGKVTALVGPSGGGKTTII
ncbi:MAG: ABC transporter ATP-binding protein, partial [Pseudomonadota bacterium]